MARGSGKHGHFTKDGAAWCPILVFDTEDSIDLHEYADNTTGGKLFTKILSPPGAIVRKIGGPSYRYHVDGANRTGGAGGLETLPAEPGLWRVEVRDPANSADHVFLQVFDRERSVGLGFESGGHHQVRG